MVQSNRAFNTPSLNLRNPRDVASLVSRKVPGALLVLLHTAVQRETVEAAGGPVGREAAGNLDRQLPSRVQAHVFNLLCTRWSVALNSSSRTPKNLAFSRNFTTLMMHSNNY